MIMSNFEDREAHTAGQLISNQKVYTSYICTYMACMHHACGHNVTYINWENINKIIYIQLYICK